MPFDNFPKQEINKQQDPEFKKMMDILERLKAEAPVATEEDINEDIFSHIESSIVDIKEKIEEEETEEGIKKHKKTIYIVANDKIKIEDKEYEHKVEIRVDNYIRGWFETKKLVPKKVEEIINCLNDIKDTKEVFEFIKIKKANGKIDYDLGEELKKIIHEKLENIYIKLTK